jgi:hypothetical protein
VTKSSRSAEPPTSPQTRAVMSLNSAACVMTSILVPGSTLNQR